METNTNLDWEYTTNKIENLVSTTSDIVVYMIENFPREKLLNNAENLILKSYLTALKESNFDKQREILTVLNQKIDNFENEKLKDFVNLLVYQASEILTLDPNNINIENILQTKYSTIANDGASFFMFKDKNNKSDISNSSKIANFNSNALKNKTKEIFGGAVAFLSELNVAQL